MELHGSFEDGIRASKQVQENHYLRYAVHFLLCSCMRAEPAGTWFSGIWNDHSGICTDDILSNPDRNYYRMDQEDL